MNRFEDKRILVTGASKGLGKSAAIAFEKKIKGWKRFKKVTMIEEENPGWDDLAGDWF